jgi:hypothetical protein
MKNLCLILFLNYILTYSDYILTIDQLPSEAKGQVTFKFRFLDNVLSELQCFNVTTPVSKVEYLKDNHLLIAWENPDRTVTCIQPKVRYEEVLKLIRVLGAENKVKKNTSGKVIVPIEIYKKATDVIQERSFIELYNKLRDEKVNIRVAWKRRMFK